MAKSGKATSESREPALSGPELDDSPTDNPETDPSGQNDSDGNNDGGEDDEANDSDESPNPDTAHGNRAIHRCIRAWNRAYNKVLPTLDEDASDYEAIKAGNLAYLRAMPPLVGHENIANFLACVAFAQMNEFIYRKEATEMRATAKVALAALRLQPKRSAKTIGETPEK